MRKLFHILIIAIFCAVTQKAAAQDVRDHWLWSNHLHLQFTSSGPVVLDSVPFLSFEAASSLSDEDGQLLFYSNNNRVFNREHNIMPNGDSLDLDNDHIGSSVANASMILPDPGDESGNIYYLFSVVDQRILVYSKIDMLLDEERGDVISGQKSIVLLADSMKEQLEAIKHASGKDWWVVTRKGLIDNFDHPLSSEFQVLLLNETGFTKLAPQDLPPMQYWTGEMAASPDGTKLAFAGNGILSIFSFDRCTGQVSLLLTIEDSLLLKDKLYTCEFSPDGSKIYLAPDIKTHLYQIDISDIDSPQIHIIYAKSSDIFTNGGQLEIGPDNKIYWNIRRSVVFGDSLLASYLHVINQPNLPGLSCNFDTFAVWLNGMESRSYSLPNHPNYYLEALPDDACDTIETSIEVILESYIVSIYPTISNGYINVTQSIPLEKVNIQIFNTNGKQWKEVLLESQNIIIDLTDAPSGLYLIRTANEKGQAKTFKVILR